MTAFFYTMKFLRQRTPARNLLVWNVDGFPNRPRSRALYYSRSDNSAGLNRRIGRRLLSGSLAVCVSRWSVCSHLRLLQSDQYDAIPQRGQRFRDAPLPRPGAKTPRVGGQRAGDIRIGSYVTTAPGCPGRALSGRLVIGGRLRYAWRPSRRLYAPRLP